MIEVLDSTEVYLTQFNQLEKRAGGGPDAWLLPIRKAAMARFAELGFPTTRDEEWRYTNVAPIARGTFEPATAPQAAVNESQIGPFLFDRKGGAVLVFINGTFAPAL